MVIESITLIATPFPSFILFLFKGVSPAKVVSTAIAKSGNTLCAVVLAPLSPTSSCTVAANVTLFPVFSFFSIFISHIPVATLTRLSKDFPARYPSSLSSIISAYGHIMSPTFIPSSSILFLLPTPMSIYSLSIGNTFSLSFSFIEWTAGPPITP